MNNNAAGKYNIRRWYHAWWGVMLAGLAALLVCVVVFLGSLTLYYWWKIKHGQGGEIARSLMKQSGGENYALEIKRRELEREGSPYLGNPEANIVIVEFIDYKCPNSREAAAVARRLVGKYGHKVKIIIRHFPSESIHSGSSRFSELAYCAGEQGRFWEMHYALFDNFDSLPANLTDEDIRRLADMSSSDRAALAACLESGRAKTTVNRDYADGYKYQVRATPAFFVNGQKISGSPLEEDWEKYLKNL